MIYYLMAFCAIFLILPFLMGYTHLYLSQRTAPVVIYYRYFMFFNVLLTGLIVALRMFLDGPNVAAISGWAYSPVYHLYGIAVLSLVVLALFTCFSKSAVMVSPAIAWVAFLAMSTVSHLWQIADQEIGAMGILFVHVIYNVIVCVILLRFMGLLNTHFHQRTGITHDETHSD